MPEIDVGGSLPDRIQEGLERCLKIRRHGADDFVVAVVAHAASLPATGIGLSAFEGRYDDRTWREMERAIIKAGGVSADGVIRFFDALADDEDAVGCDLLRKIMAARGMMSPAATAARRGTMSPADFKAARHRLGLSAEVCAGLLGVESGRTVRRWEAGDREIPGPVEVIMKAVIASPEVRRYFGLSLADAP